MYIPFSVVCAFALARPLDGKPNYRAVVRLAGLAHSSP